MFHHFFPLKLHIDLQPATCRVDTLRLTLHTRYRRRYNSACDDRRRRTLGRRAQDTYSLHYHVFTLRILGNPVALADHARYDVRDFARNTLQPTPSPSCESCARDRSSDSNSHFDHDTLALAFSRARPPLPINSSSLHRATLANAHVTMTKSVEFDCSPLTCICRNMCIHSLIAALITAIHNCNLTFQ